MGGCYICDEGIISVTAAFLHNGGLVFVLPEVSFLELSIKDTFWRFCTQKYSDLRGRGRRLSFLIPALSIIQVKVSFYTHYTRVLYL